MSTNVNNHKPNLELILQPYGAALHDTRTKEFFIFNPTGSKILEGTAQGLTEDGIVELISDEVSSDSSADRNTISSDVSTFMSILRNFGITLPDVKNAVILGNRRHLSTIAAQLELTQQCSFACQYCLVNGSPKGEPGLSVETWIRVVESLIDKGLRQVTLTGGDPPESEAFWPILNLLSKSDMVTTVYTAGRKVDLRFMQRLADCNFGDRLAMQVSLDSTDRRINDRYRGLGAYDAAVNAANLSLHYGVHVIIASLIFPDTISHLESLFMFARKYDAEIKIGLLDFFGRAKEVLDEEKVILSREDARKFNHEYVRLREAFPSVASDLLRLDREATIVKDVYTNRYVENLTSRKCPVAFGFVDVDWNGFLKPCPFPVSYLSDIDTDYVLYGDPIMNIDNFQDSPMFKKASGISESVDSEGKWGGCVLYEHAKRK